MSTKQITPVAAGFESLKQTNEHNAEYWHARDLQPLLGYAQWRRFEQAIERAIPRRRLICLAGMRHEGQVVRVSPQSKMTPCVSATVTSSRSETPSRKSANLFRSF